MSGNTYFRLELAIRTIDVDQNYFVRPFVYIHWLEEACANYFTSKGWSYPDLNQPGNLLYLSSLNLHHIIPVNISTAGRSIAVECLAITTEAHLITFEYEIQHTQQRDLVFATATTQMTFFNSEGKEIPTPDSWKVKS